LLQVLGFASGLSASVPNALSEDYPILSPGSAIR
jgi:hypothetical protein